MARRYRGYDAFPPLDTVILYDMSREIVIDAFIILPARTTNESPGLIGMKWSSTSFELYEYCMNINMMSCPF